MFRGRPMPPPGDPADPLWLDDDRDWALALLADEAAACPGCGEPFSLSTDPESEGQYVAEAIRCHACAAQSKADHGIDNKAGLLVTFTRRPTPSKE